MWPTIARARHRLGGPVAIRRARRSRADCLEATADAAVRPSPAGERVRDVVILLSGPEVDRLRTALVLALGSTADRPDTPMRLGSALSRVLEARRADGRPSVLRRPATISTPEAWEIRVTGAAPATGDAIRAAARTGRFEP